MTNKDTFYDILGIGENATSEEIKKAYRSMQMKYHPDKNPGNQDALNMTQKINEAYEVLSDKQKRNIYDMNLRGGMSNIPMPNTFRFTRNFPNGFQNSNDANSIPLDDIFNMMFNGMGGIFEEQPNMPFGHNIHIINGNAINMRQALNKPPPILKTIQINMFQVFNGDMIPVEIERWIIENGLKVFEKETIYVEIPAGIDDNEFIILRNKGNILNENLKGDIKFSISIKNDTHFKRIGLDLVMEKIITLKESLCGFYFDINHINGKNYTLNNNKGNIIQPEYKKIYNGLGIKRGEHKGNLIINFHITFPEKLTEEQILQLSNIL